MRLLFDAIFIIVPVLLLGMIIFTFAMVFSDKLRGKFMSKQIKATKYMMENIQDDLSDIGTSVIKTKKNILERNEEDLETLETKESTIKGKGITIKANALRKGLKGDTIYCKHCGELIDSDSKFCKSCGKKQ